MDGIHSVHGAYLYPPAPQQVPPQTGQSQPSRVSAEADSEHVKKVMAEMQSVSHIFNTRLEYRYNETLKQVVVKVFDSSTDTLIKELPSAELQAVHARIKEVLGLMSERRS